METITFYSYKGGAGRTLVLANVAKYLARFNKSVFAIDFDLEAPGLHYKFELDANGTPLTINRGVVDYLYEFVTEGSTHRLRDYVVEVTGSNISNAKIHLLPAGNVPAADYWQKLSRINWHELFYSPSAKGVPLFLELQERIRDEFNPDFLLIDSRTGITEIGGVATTILADKVICLVLANDENLEGARAVLRSINAVPRSSGTSSTEIIVALTRIPEMGDNEERGIIDRTLSVLNAEAENLADTLSLSNIFVLHSEPELQIDEQLRVGNKSPDESILLRDYIRLFTYFIPKELIAPQIQELVQQATAASLDNPEGAEKDLEVLMQTTGHPDAYRALLKFYRLRNAPKSKVYPAALRLWEITHIADDPILWDVAVKQFDEVNRYLTAPDYPWQWIEQVWRAAGANNTKVGVALAKSFNNFEQYSRAADILLSLLSSNHNPTEDVAITAISSLRRAKRTDEGNILIKEYLPVFGNSKGFLQQCISFLIEQNERSAIEEFLILVPVDKLFSVSPRAHELLRAVGRMEEADEILSQVVDEVIKQGLSPELQEIGRYYYRLGKGKEFDNLVKLNSGATTGEIDSFLRPIRVRYRNRPIGA